MSKDKAPMEWTVYVVDNSFECLYDADEPLPDLDEPECEELIPVIERSAYDALEAKLAECVKTLEYVSKTGIRAFNIVQEVDACLAKVKK